MSKCTCGSVGAVVVAAALTWATVAPVAGQTAPKRPPAAKASLTPPRTPWGDPDISGIFTNKDEQGVPLERPAEFAGREIVTDEELSARAARAQRQLEIDNAEFDITKADTSNAGQVGRHVASTALARSREPSRGRHALSIRPTAGFPPNAEGQSAWPIGPRAAPSAQRRDRLIHTWTEV